MQRRELLAAALLAVGLPYPALGGSTRRGHYLSTAADPEGQHWLVAFGTGEGGVQLHYRIPLPARGHHVAVHPGRGLYAVIARRPDTWLMLGDLTSGEVLQTLQVPTDRHLFGHGVFADDGTRFYTTESDLGNWQGDSGLVVEWEVGNVAGRASLQRGREFSSAGVGPHELLLMPDGQTLAVANGGLRTHPDSGREVLNVDTMLPSLVYLDRHSGELLEQHTLPEALRLASIRHLDVNPHGQLVMGLQYQGEPWEQVPLVATHERGSAPRLLSTPPELLARMKQYVGSVRYVDGGRSIVASCPRGNLLAFWSSLDGGFAGSLPARDACGLATAGAGLLFSTGVGRVASVELPALAVADLPDDANGVLLWDNHLTEVPGGWPA